MSLVNSRRLVVLLLAFAPRLRVSSDDLNGGPHALRLIVDEAKVAHLQSYLACYFSMLTVMCLQRAVQQN